MQPDTLPLVQLLGPLALVLGAVCLLGPALPRGRPWAPAADELGKALEVLGRGVHDLDASRAPGAHEAAPR